MTVEKPVGMTVTGEIFQPVRLYYEIHDQKKVKKCLERLRCIQFDAPRNRWLWLYDEEAKSIDFKTPFASIPKDLCPVVIGSFVWKSAKMLILDVRSFERALEAIQFFDKKISRSIATVTHCAVVNRIFEAQESVGSNFDVYFEDNDKMVVIDPEAIIDRMKKTPLSTNNLPNFQAITSFLDNEMERFFEVEKFPIHFYDEGIDSLRSSFILRQTIAMQRWNGNDNYSFKDVFSEMFK